MATERLPPDALLAKTNLTGSLADIDDDPDSPDGAWLTTSAGNNTEVYVSFPDASGPLTGTQEYRALVRTTGEATNPTGRVELWDGGSLVRAGSDVTISTDTVLSFTWDAAEASNPELKVIGTTGGGKPADRGSLEVGAIEWNVSYSASSNETVSPAAGELTVSSEVVVVRLPHILNPDLVLVEVDTFIPEVLRTDNHVRAPPAVEIFAIGMAPNLPGAGVNIVVRPGMMPDEREQHVAELLGL